jgi:hypothetical protein
MDEETRAFVVATCAIIGAGLGVLNLYRTWLSDSERLRVAVIAGGADEYPGVEVVNVSPFPITVTHLRSVHPDGQTSPLSIELKDMRNDAIPKRIEARHSHLFRVSMRETIAMHVHKPSYYYVRTALGNVFTTEPAPARWWRRAKEALRLKKADF